MDELAEQIRVYYDATTEPIRSGRPVVVGGDEWTLPPLARSFDGDEDDVAPFDVRFDPLVGRNDPGVVIPGSDRPISPRRRWLLMAAAVAVPALVVGALVAVSRDDEQEFAVSDNTLPAGSSTAATEDASTVSAALDNEGVARRFLESYGSWRFVEELRSVAGDADFSGMTGRTGLDRDLDSFTTWLEAVGYQQTLTGCEELMTSASRGAYRCSFEYQMLHSHNLELGPYSGSYFDVAVSDGKILSASVYWNTESFSPEVWEPFADWIAADYPDDVAIMYTDGTLSESATTDESIGLWRALTREYATLQTGIDYEAGDYLVSRHSMTVDGVTFSLSVPARGWETFEGFLLSKSTHGPQGAEAVIYWAAFPDGEKADPCLNLEWDGLRLLDDVAAEVAAMPGVALRSGPSDVTIGGRDAKHVALTVTEDAGCDPGLFYNWKAQTGGAMWDSPELGDTIEVWIVDVDGTVLFICGMTHPDAFSGRVAEEIQNLVASMIFEKRR